MKFKGLFEDAGELGVVVNNAGAASARLRGIVLPYLNASALPI
jgi:hypothetical protein